VRCGTSVQAVGFQVEYLGRAMWNVCSGRSFPGGVSGSCDVFVCSGRRFPGGVSGPCDVSVCSGRRFPGGVSGSCDVERLFMP